MKYSGISNEIFKNINMYKEIDFMEFLYILNKTSQKEHIFMLFDEKDGYYKILFNNIYMLPDIIFKVNERRNMLILEIYNIQDIIKKDNFIDKIEKLIFLYHDIVEKGKKNLQEYNFLLKEVKEGIKKINEQGYYFGVKFKIDGNKKLKYLNLDYIKCEINDLEKIIDKFFKIDIYNTNLKIQSWDKLDKILLISKKNKEKELISTLNLYLHYIKNLKLYFEKTYCNIYSIKNKDFMIDNLEIIKKEKSIVSVFGKVKRVKNVKLKDILKKDIYIQNKNFLTILKEKFFN